MIKKFKVKRGGIEKTWVSVVEGYRPEPGAAPKQRTIKSFGYLEDQTDPAAFMKEVEEFNRNYREEKVPLRIEVEGTAKMYRKENRKQNYGYKYLEAVYNMLGIEAFIKEQVKKSGFKGKYEPWEIFKFLVLTRIMQPDSKRASFQQKENYYGMNTEFVLQDVYRSLDVFSNIEASMQRHLNEQIKEKIGRDLTHAFYDVTNYYFEIDFPDGDDDLRQKGVSKEHRVDPIAAMGLFMDTNGIPIAMSVFPGNKSETLTLQPTIRDVKESYGLGRLVVVADKGLNSSKNIDALVNKGDGFVFSQVLRGKKGQRYEEKLFASEGWTSNATNTYRYKMFDEEYIGCDLYGEKTARTRRVLLYWNQEEANMAKHKRDEKIRKAERRIHNNAYGIKKGVEEYTKESIVDKQSGEILEDVKKLRSVNIEKAEKDALYDGYFCIITSELDYDESQIRLAYRGLWRIEQSFRIMKSDLYARPVYVSLNSHIRAHFLVCFVALLIIRVIQHGMADHAISAERISRALREANCRVYKGGIVQLDDVGGALAFEKRLDKHGDQVDTLKFSADDEIALDYKAIQSFFHTDLYNVFYRQELFNRLLASIAVV